MKKNRPGFMGFVAQNVNLTAPTASAKWDRFVDFINSNKTEIEDKYGDSNEVLEILDSVNVETTPDKLLKVSKAILKLVNTKEKDVVSHDPVIFDLVDALADVAKQSYDKRVISITKEIANTLINYRKLSSN